MAKTQIWPFLIKAQLHTKKGFRALFMRKKLEHQGGNSQNFLSKFVRFFVTLRCFYGVVIH